MTADLLQARLATLERLLVETVDPQLRERLHEYIDELKREQDGGGRARTGDRAEH